MKKILILFGVISFIGIIFGIYRQLKKKKSEVTTSDANSNIVPPGTGGIKSAPVDMLFDSEGVLSPQALAAVEDSILPDPIVIKIKSSVV